MTFLGRKTIRTRVRIKINFAVSDIIKNFRITGDILPVIDKAFNATRSVDYFRKYLIFPIEGYKRKNATCIKLTVNGKKKQTAGSKWMKSQNRPRVIMGFCYLPPERVKMGQRSLWAAVVYLLTE